MSEAAKNGKRFRKARRYGSRSWQRRDLRKLNRDGGDYWAVYAWGARAPGRMIPASKAGRGRWRR